MILLSIAGFIFGIVPAVQKIAEIKNQSLQLSASVERLQTKLKLLDNNDEIALRDQLVALLAAVPSDKSLPTLFSTIDGLSSLTGVTVTELALTKPGSLATGSGTAITSEEKKIGSSLLPFTVTITGTFDQIHAFLAQIVAVRRFLRVRNFEILYSNTTMLTVHLGMDAYYVPIRQFVGSVEAPLATFSEKDQQIISQVTAMPVVGVAESQAITPNSQTEPARTDPFSL